MKIRFVQKGSFEQTRAYLRRVDRLNIPDILHGLAQRGVEALQAATPRESGLAASSWGYRVTTGRRYCAITWINTDVEDGFPVAIMLQYGYSTGTGGYVHGEDYINPAMRPVFDQIANELWRRVTSA